MTTTTVHSEGADAHLLSQHGTYATAADGANLVVDGGGANILDIGQAFIIGTSYCAEGFISFDTSGIPDGDVVSAVTLSLWGDTDASATDFTIEAYEYDWSTSVTTADWRTPAQIAALTRVATFATTGFTAGAYNVFTSDAAFLTAINKTGSTRLLLVSSRHRTQTAPGGNEYVLCPTSEASGTTNDPRLVIDHAPAPATGGFLGVLL